MKTFSIAIDGPAGAGKSTIAKKIAEDLACIYIDTGAMYRSVGYYCLQNQIDYQDEEAVCKSLGDMHIILKTSDQGQQIYLNDVNVSQSIRTDIVAAAASKVATYGPVRSELVKRQQEMASLQSVVMDGRDIGTVVLPFATLKIFLTASVDERAKRRYKEYIEKGMDVSLETLKDEIKARDAQDAGRKISPLKKAEDAVEIDTTYMHIDEIVECIKNKLLERL